MFITVLFPFISAECSEVNEGTAALHDQTGMALVATSNKTDHHNILIMLIAFFSDSQIVYSNFRKFGTLRWGCHTEPYHLVITGIFSSSLFPPFTNDFFKTV